jgi:glutaryl-CoA dehydrogenase
VGAIGHAVASYEAAVTYAKERVQFGKPIASFQIIQNKLANMLAEITTMQLLCFRLAQLQEAGKMTGGMASIAKMNNAKKAKQVCSEARDVLGGNGVLLDYYVARHLSTWRSSTPTREPTLCNPSSWGVRSPASERLCRS